MSSIDYSLNIDRDSNTFDMSISYYIPGYDDPETGEQFYNTSWNYYFADQNGGGGTGNWGSWESETVPVYLGFPSGEDVSDGTLTFSAQNDFSGVSVSESWHILNAGTAHSNKVIVGSAGPDIILSGYGSDVLRGNAGNDFIDAGPGDDIVEGGDGADQLYGGSGNDILIGGADSDFYAVDSMGDVIVETENGGAYDSVVASSNYTLAPYVEALSLIGDARNGIGNEQDNRIDGNEFINILEGEGGNDNLAGYGGNDLLRGGAGEDYLDGGTGKDRMEGGLGNDHYVVDQRTDAVIELANEGVDEVRVQGLSSYTLGENLENLTNVGGLAKFRGTGNTLDNVLSGDSAIDTLLGLEGNDTLNGNGGNDILEGGVGGDALNGGEGFDSASYANAARGVTVNLLTGAGTRGEATGDSFNSIEALIGSAYDDNLTGGAGPDQLTGGAGNDTLRGGDGDDWLIGGAGGDKLYGGAGEDVVRYSSSSAGVIVNLATQTASGGDATGDTLLSISGVDGSNFVDTLTGNNAANRLYGRAGDDVIDAGGGDDVVRGGAGADMMTGGSGDDTLDYTGSGAGVTVNLAAQTSSGGDADGDIFTGFERARGSSYADTLIGNNRANYLFGGDGDDTLTGGDGNDTIGGGAGADVMDGGAGIDTLSYAGSTERVYIHMESGTAYFGDAMGDSFTNFENLRGGEVTDYLYGNGGANRIDGRAGDDWLAGYGGDDRLYGGAGSDTFLFEWGSDIERVMDFRLDGTADTLFINLGATFDSMAEVMAVGAQVGADTVFTFAPGQQMILQGVQMTTMTAQDFVFPTLDMV